MTDARISIIYGRSRTKTIKSEMKQQQQKKVPLQPKLCDRLSRLAIQAISGHWKDVQEAITLKYPENS